MGKIQFNPDEEGELELARYIVLERLRTDRSWQQYDLTGQGFDRIVEYVGNSQQGRSKLTILAQDVLWELMTQGVIAPGLNMHNPNLPWFHITEYGEKVLECGEYVPHDPAGYLDMLHTQCPNIDATVLAYLTESLNCFTRSNLISVVVMLGVASEQAFLLLCESLLNALESQKEGDKFRRILYQRAIKPKMDFVLKKVEEIQNKYKRPLPDNVNIMLAAIFDFIRCQRNELGHPRPVPPKVSREEAFVNLRIFPNYYSMTQQVIHYLESNSV